MALLDVFDLAIRPHVGDVHATNFPGEVENVGYATCNCQACLVVAACVGKCEKT